MQPSTWPSNLRMQNIRYSLLLLTVPWTSTATVAAELPSTLIRVKPCDPTVPNGACTTITATGSWPDPPTISSAFSSSSTTPTLGITTHVVTQPASTVLVTSTVLSTTIDSSTSTSTPGPITVTVTQPQIQETTETIQKTITEIYATTETRVNTVTTIRDRTLTVERTVTETYAITNIKNHTVTETHEVIKTLERTVTERVITSIPPTTETKTLTVVSTFIPSIPPATETITFRVTVVSSLIPSISTRNTSITTSTTFAQHSSTSSTFSNTSSSSLSDTPTPGTPVSTATASLEPQPQTAGGRNTAMRGAMIGVAVPVTVILAGVTLFFAYRRWQKRQREESRTRRIIHAHNMDLHSPQDTSGKPLESYRDSGRGGGGG